MEYMRVMTAKFDNLLIILEFVQADAALISSGRAFDLNPVVRLSLKPKF